MRVISNVSSTQWIWAGVLAAGLIVCAGCASAGRQARRPVHEAATSTAPHDYLSNQADTMAEEDAKGTRSTTTSPAKKRPRPDPIKYKRKSPVDQPRTVR